MSLLLFVFPPVAWYQMYHQPRFHKWFAYLLLFNAIPPLLVNLFQGIVVLPKLQTLYTQMSVNSTQTTAYMTLIIPSLIFLVQIVMGLVVLKKAHSFGTDKKLLLVSIIFLASDLLIEGLLVASSVSTIIMPIYSLTSSALP